MELERVDNKAEGKPNGFYYDRYLKYKQDDEFYRDKWRVYGVRILLSSEGVANKVSVHMIVFNIASAATLFRMTWIFTDFIMLYCMRKREDYRIHKI